jgi:hypothetical protein
MIADRPSAKRVHSQDDYEQMIHKRGLFGVITDVHVMDG